MLSGALTVADPDSLNLTNATVKITGGTFAGDGDVLAANVSGTSITASYNAGAETLTLTGHVTPVGLLKLPLSGSVTGVPIATGVTATVTVNLLLNVDLSGKG